jgi:hypothetical protein
VASFGHNPRSSHFTDVKSPMLSGRLESSLQSRRERSVKADRNPNCSGSVNSEKHSDRSSVCSAVKPINDSGSFAGAELLRIFNVVSDDATLPKSSVSVRLQHPLRSKSVSDVSWLSEPDVSVKALHLRKHTLSSRCNALASIIKGAVG